MDCVLCATLHFVFIPVAPLSKLPHLETQTRLTIPRLPSLRIVIILVLGLAIVHIWMLSWMRMRMIMRESVDLDFPDIAYVRKSIFKAYWDLFFMGVCRSSFCLCRILRQQFMGFSCLSAMCGFTVVPTSSAMSSRPLSTVLMLLFTK